MKKFCILTLTHESKNRPSYLKETIDSFLNNTEYDEIIDWFIYINKSNEKFITTCNELIEKYKDKVDFKIVHSNINNGVGYGINRLNELGADYTYSLFLEGDWKCMSSEISGQSKNWLKSSLKLLEENQTVDAVFLRRYINDYESRSTGILGYTNINDSVELELDSLKYFIAPIGSYTNNPLVRRNSSFYNKKVFPLKEFFDENGNPTELKIDNEMYPNWGAAEIEAASVLHCNPNNESNAMTYAFLMWGTHCHIDDLGNQYDHESQSFYEKENTKGCKKYKNGQSTCKFGYYNISPHFCTLCSIDTKPINLVHLFSIESEMLDTLEINKNIWSNDEKVNFVKNYIQNPELNTENFTKYFI
jgi:hypothetical protein